MKKKKILFLFKTHKFFIIVPIASLILSACSNDKLFKYDITYEVVKKLQTFILEEKRGGESSLPFSQDSSSENQTSFLRQKFDLWSQGTQLRGANMFQGEKYTKPGKVWNPLITQQDLLDLGEAGANYVNYSIPGLYNVDDYQRNEAFFLKMDELISYAEKANLFIVLSFRTGPGRSEADLTSDGELNRLLFSSEEAQAAFLKMWKEVALRYKNKKNIAAYDLLVEPHDVDIDIWRLLAQKTINEIRSVDSSIPIFASPNNWGVASSLEKWKPLSGENIIYTVQ